MLPYFLSSLANKMDCNGLESSRCAADGACGATGASDVDDAVGVEVAVISAAADSIADILLCMDGMVPPVGISDGSAAPRGCGSSVISTSGTAPLRTVGAGATTGARDVSVGVIITDGRSKDVCTVSGMLVVQAYGTLHNLVRLGCLEATSTLRADYVCGVAVQKMARGVKLRLK